MVDYFGGRNHVTKKKLTTAKKDASREDKLRRLGNNSIRKHGAYINDAILEEAIKSQDFVFELFWKLQAEKGKTEALLDKVEALAPKARYYDIILQSSGVVQVSLIAKDYGMTAVAFNRLMHDLGIQFRAGTTCVLYKRHAACPFVKPAKISAETVLCGYAW